MTTAPSPFVYWAQNEDFVTLRIDLKDVKNPEVSLSPTTLKFSAHGHGARGIHEYSFSLDFNQALDPDESSFNLTERQVDFSLRKKKKGWWQRLTATPQKPAWLKIDFERWKYEDAEEEEEKRDVISDYPELYKRLHKDEIGYIREDVKRVYLIFYNLCQFVGFLFVLSVLGVRYYRDGEGSMIRAYESVGTAMKFCQLMQFLEIMHTMFGYTKGSIITPILQVFGRALILFFMIDAEPRMQTKPVVFYLIVVWSLVEVVRYPYYITQLYKKNIYLLTWLRYTIWIPLYPLGILCEGVIVLRNIPYFEETGRFTIAMPNKWNFAFHMPSFMKLYLLCLFFPGMYTMMMHMYRARCKKLGPNNWRKRD